ncbi:MAG: CxxxxCH/CxxCH domain-containing protein, partial [Deltaproteobacteria bacterium]|nr:CxxxxCH/CxxCH domain-containing protein [Deltaproteobacteria bacterium]
MAATRSGAWCALVALLACSEEPPGPSPNDGCRTCHGSRDNPAPPLALDGSSDAWSRGVGAHQVHLLGQRLERTVACEECHVRPDTIDAPGHLDSTPGAEVVFGSLSNADGVQSTWASDALTCTTYCHGVSLSGGSVTHPVWTRVDGSQTECGSCHGMPPPAPHPAARACALCHDTAGPNDELIDPLRHADGRLDVRETSECSACHGSDTNSAPPRDLLGRGITTEPGVGAHQTHLTGGVQSRPVECSDCHLVPTEMGSPGHVDSDVPAELVFKATATLRGASPKWNRETATCSDSYCHGSRLEGSRPHEPVWTRVDGTEARCGQCHGLPPSEPHPANDRCELCHLPTAGPERTIANRLTHVDGVVQVAIEACTGCHGSTNNLAPPKDTDGRSDTAVRSVGAHQTHVLGGRSSLPVACDACHEVPLSVDAPGHRDSAAPAEVRFSGLARVRSHDPGWDGTSCQDSYCHTVSSTAGGIRNDPTWTRVDGSQATCGSCHGLPPAPPHPESRTCSLCHGPTAGPGLTVANRATHVDGILQVTDGRCASCHGSTNQPAPPRDLLGRSDTTVRTVGAHRSHVEGTLGLSRAVSCTECHVVPARLESPGHVDTDPPAELSFGPLATTASATPTFVELSATCESVYCHGSSLVGGRNTTPTWVQVDGSQASCGSCHGIPPGGDHPRDDRCSFCHLPTAGPGQRIAEPTTHIDGRVQAAKECDSCHGKAGEPAPPKDLDGHDETTAVGVGAHRTHLAGGVTGRPVACSECHAVPILLDDPGHIDTPRPAELIFGNLAGLGHTPEWAAPTCSETYCHAGVGAANSAPSWTTVDGTQAECGACHGIPPPTTVHQTDQDCSNCHLPTAGPNRTIADRNTHGDGILHLTDLDCASCHGDASSPAPPVDLDGNAESTDPEVGAHRAHLSGGEDSAAVACTACHRVPQTRDEAGHVDSDRPAEVSFSGRASADGSAPTYSSGTCSETYCHTASGASEPSPAWDRPGTDCESCHGFPPPLPHPQRPRCENCHAPVAGPDRSILEPTRHVDGIVDVDPDRCDSCHGSATNAAPPRDLDGQSEVTSLTVGAHQTHLAGGAAARPVACAECHVAPEALGDPGHIDTPAPAELTFGSLAKRDGHDPSWERASASCSDAYCHGESRPAWTQPGSAPCGSCHELPPAAPHPRGTRCELCHLPTAGPGRTIAHRETHVDGVVQAATEVCTGCHGTQENLAPPVDTAGRSDPSLRSVGAHQSHVNGGRFSRPVSCIECHLVPVAVTDPGHADTPPPAELSFGPTSTSHGRQPSWDGSRCTDSYCHVGSGGTVVSPRWTAPTGTEATCGACHGLPPPLPHPANDRCSLCHAPTAGPGTTIAQRATHVNGVLEVTSGECTSCHGSDLPAPPYDLAGRADPTLQTVGAHRAHLSAPAGISRPVACSECHLVPDVIDAPGHVDTPQPAEVRFGALASSAGTVASYDGTNATCDEYCHGASVGRALPSPAWTDADGSEGACGSCHGNPPAVAHPPDDRCELCHLPTAGPNRTIADPTTHIDGVVQAASGCDGCHGQAGNSAPPFDLDHAIETTRITVGAHQTHLSGGISGRPVACSECHLVPAALESPGHVDSLRPAELVFGPTAAARGRLPTWSSPACSETACHSGPDAAKPDPVWNAVDGAQAACGGCHGIPPNTPSHRSSADCSTCHLPTAGPGATIAQRSTHVDGIVQVTDLDCASCHGDATSAAPPRDLAGDGAPTDPEVGTHRAHLSGGQSSAAVPCATCHIVPVTKDEPGHLDSLAPAEVILGGRASAEGREPTYSAGSCASTYCHSLSGAGVPTPVWNAPGTLSCAGCHGMPPPAPHPANGSCQLCHAPVAAPGQVIADRTRHADGTLDVQDSSCGRCHGSADNSAPPPDLLGGSDVTQITVGAHQAHLSGGARSRAVACDECHFVPTELNDIGHIDSPPPAELSFGPLAKQDANPRFARASATCADTYCHGSAQPVWTQPGSAICGSCHDLPPDAPHPANDSCELCHLPTAGPNRSIANPTTHVDGIVDVAIDGCLGCHGTAANLAPPTDTLGRSAVSLRSVGAHQTHLAGGRASRAVSCDECHRVPTSVAEAGHNDTPTPAELTFGSVATTGGSAPSWNGVSCSTSYCHNGPGASTPSPRWSVVDGTEAACGACHGLPPPAPHPVGSNCGLCHAPTAGPGQSIAQPSTHVNGVLEVTSGGCTDCHGSGESSAPPVDLLGQSDPSLRTVGAHRVHVEAPSSLSRPVACGECHTIPATLASPGHVDTSPPAEVRFGSLASAGGLLPTYELATASCQVYCHGSTLDRQRPEPIWMSTGGVESACGACHGNPPAGGHPSDDRCELCHLPTAGANQTIANASTHIDGILQAAEECDSCHGSAGNSAPPVDLDGASATSLATVGAHRTHLSGGVSSKPVSCTECHVVPSELDSPGHIDTPRPAELVFGGVATAGGHDPAYSRPTCSGTSCHAGVSASTPSPSWTVVNGTQAECGDCHGLPPNTPSHRSSADCSTCHLPTAGPNRTIANRATHVDGVVQVTTLDCTSCHGDSASSAPPVDLAGQVAVTDPQVGAHRAHLSGGVTSSPVSCGECHVVPSQADSPGHLDSPSPAEVSFSGRATLGGASPSYSVGACGNTYCHGRSGGSNPSPEWDVPGSAACGSCHGLPPPSPHPVQTACENCHGPVAGPNQTIADRSRHGDGQLDVVDTDCGGCHGSATNAAPPRDLSGQSAVTVLTVGVHQSHLSGGVASRAVSCNECHVVPLHVGDAGHVDTASPAEVSFGSLSKSGGAVPSWSRVTASCGNSYCHGEGQAVWTSPGTAPCGSCHGLPPAAPHPQNDECAVCHLPTAGPGVTVANRATHVDGVVQVAISGCVGCHGSASNLAPPVDTSGQGETSLRTVGAHQRHLSGGQGSRAVACSECHSVPTTVEELGHNDTPPPAEVRFGTLSKTGG